MTDNDRRGAQVFATDLEGALSARGADVHTVALGPGERSGLELETLGPTRRHPKTLRALRRTLRTADVVVGHGSTTLPMCAIATIGTRVPFVYRQISDMVFWAPTIARRARVRLALQRAAKVVALAPEGAGIIEARFGVAANRVEVIPNGVDGKHFSPPDRAEVRAARIRFGVDPDRPVIVYAGALVPEKGVDIAIDAVATLPGVQLVVAGDGPEAGALQRRADQRAVGQVLFVGRLSDPRASYAAADVVVLPSRGGDSMPAALIEAGLMGLPVVSTRIGSIPEIVIDGITGHLVETDSSRALAATVASLLEDPVRSTALGSSARAHCLERFDLPVVARQWLELLERVVAGDDGAPRRGRGPRSDGAHSWA